MKFTICYDTSKKTPAIPRVVLRLSGLANVERLSLHTGHGCTVFTRQVPMVKERLESIRLLHDPNVDMVCHLVLNNRTASGMPCERTSEVFRTYDTELLGMLEHYGIEMDGLARPFGKEAAADE